MATNPHPRPKGPPPLNQNAPAKRTIKATVLSISIVQRADGSVDRRVEVQGDPEVHRFANNVADALVKAMSVTPRKPAKKKRS